MKKTLTLRERYLSDKRKKKIKIIALQIGLLILFFGLWELLAQTEVIDSFITSCPSRMFRTLKLLVKQDLFKHLGITLLECICGFLIATVLGTIIAILLWWSKTLRKVLEPYIVVLNSLPKIALGPVIIIWMGAGYGAIIAMTVLICIIVTIMSVLAGFMECDEDKILLMRAMGANKFQILFKLLLPASLPNLISVLKINVGLSWVGVIMGEYLVSSAGLGYLIIYGGQVFKLDLVMTSTMILCLLAALMYLTVALIEKHVKKSR
ncbi:ABC transporter permease [Pumilibacter intestinalis]|uniref:ABC transporter permease n=1 Tax=Pumilibacter intestinalis TaxID=2941511 RepID=UPI002040C921|nr:ABC transporter permease [Pumilibacter intestinalis]